MSTTHSRAKKGGEYGTNGEWYEGGKFIATTEKPKGKPQPRKARKVEIWPYVWVETDREAIYGKIKWDVKITNGFAAPHSMAFIGSDGGKATPAEIAEEMALIERFNRGERWLA